MSYFFYYILHNLIREEILYMKILKIIGPPHKGNTIVLVDLFLKEF